MTKTFQTLSSAESFLAGISALSYAYFFIVAKDPLMYSLSLLLLGVFSLKVMVALFGRLQKVDQDFARIALIFGIFGAAGMAIHGGYDLANAINPPAVLNTDLPSQVDPRGLLAFGFTGFAILKFSWLMAKDSYFPNGLRWIGFLSGALLVVIYVARLTVLNPANPILLYPVLVNGFVLGPLWYLWLGKVFRGK